MLEAFLCHTRSSLCSDATADRSKAAASTCGDEDARHLHGIAKVLYACNLSIEASSPSLHIPPHRTLLVGSGAHSPAHRAQLLLPPPCTALACSSRCPTELFVHPSSICVCQSLRSTRDLSQRRSERQRPLRVESGSLLSYITVQYSPRNVGVSTRARMPSSLLMDKSS